MSNVKIIVDVGSCHMGKKEYMKEMIDRCADYGVDVVKAQLFGEEYTDGGNVVFPRSWWQEMCNYAKERKIGFTASVFDKEAFDLVTASAVPFVKFAYSQTDSPLIATALQMGHKVMATYDLMNVHKAPAGVLKLYTIALNGATLYPVPFKIEFGNILYNFDGFSSHCLGIDQELAAVYAGARYLEIHFSLGYKDINCPDTFFAKNPRELQVLVKEAKR